MQKLLPRNRNGTGESVSLSDTSPYQCRSIVNKKKNKKNKKERKKKKEGKPFRRAAFNSIPMTPVFLLLLCSSECTCQSPLSPPLSAPGLPAISDTGNVTDTSAVSYFPQSVASFNSRNFYLPWSTANAAVDVSVASIERRVIAEHQVAIIRAMVR